MAEQLYFTGSGELFLCKTGATGLPDGSGFRNVGNVDMIKAGFSVTNQTHRESKSGLEKEDYRLAKQLNGTIDIMLSKYSIENLQLALYGTKTTNTGATVTAEVVTSPSNLKNAATLANFNITALTELTNAGDTVTYDLGDDYTWDAWGNIYFPTGTSITASQSLRATYTFGTSESVNAFGDIQPSLWLRVTGTNNARGNSKVLIEMPKVILDPIAEWDLISTGKTTPEQISLKGAMLFNQQVSDSGLIPNGYFRETQIVEA
jgi:hypothetical protein